MFTTQAIEGRQGNQRFLTTNIRWGELEGMLIFPDEVEKLDPTKQMQRALAKSRLHRLERYLLEVEDHFYSALTLLILPRDLDRPAREKSEEDPEEWDFAFTRAELPHSGLQRIGRLELSGDVKLFTADGQHRARSAVNAMREKPSLAREEVPIVILPYTTGERARQVFSDLNLNAKPITRTLGYEYESREPGTIIAKAVAEAVPLFEGRVNRVTDSLPYSSRNVVTLSALVQGTVYVITGLARHDFPDPKITDVEAIEKLFAAHKGRNEPIKAVVQGAFETIVDLFAEHWDRVLDSSPEDNVPGELRKEYLFPHGLGWLGLTSAAGQLIKELGDNWEEPFRKAVGSFDWHRTAKEWQGNAVLWNDDTGVNRVNNTGPAIRDLSTKIVAKAT